MGARQWLSNRSGGHHRVTDEPSQPQWGKVLSPPPLLGALSWGFHAPQTRGSPTFIAGAAGKRPKPAGRTPSSSRCNWAQSPHPTPPPGNPERGPCSPAGQGRGIRGSNGRSAGWLGTGQLFPRPGQRQGALGARCSQPSACTPKEFRPWGQVSRGGQRSGAFDLDSGAAFHPQQESPRAG